jgi:nickel-dependent lactate racemase
MRPMIVELRFGRDGLPLELPGDRDVTVIEKRGMTALAEPVRAVDAALASPVAGPPLESLARRARSACVLLCDGTRPVPNALVVPRILDALRRGGLSDDGITVLVATGLHRPDEGGVLASWTPPPGIEVIVHDARDAGSHADLGRTGRGTPCRVDRRVVDAELRIAVGLVEPHFMAGFSGGRKLVAPGCAAEETIRRLHGHALLEDPRAALGNLDGNPLHEELLEILDRVGPLHSVDLVLDDARRICHVGFGETRASHGAAVTAFRAAGEVRPGGPWPVVVTTGAGAPLDGTWYQTVKAIGAAAPAVAEGGTLLVASACGSLGSPGYRRAQERLVAEGPEGFMAHWRSRPASAIDAWQTAMQIRDARGIDVRLFTPNLSAGDRALTGLAHVDALDAALGATGHRRVAVIPEGPYVLLAQV